MRCSWCGLAVLSPEPPRCRKCNAVVCDPYLRDCCFSHWRGFHNDRAFRRVEETRPV